MKLVYEWPEGTLQGNVVAINNPSTLAKTLKRVPGVGKPFLAFPSLSGIVAQWRPNMYPDYKVGETEAETVATINEMLANPPYDAIDLA